MPGGLDTRDSQPVTHASTNRARRCLTAQIGRDGVCSTRCGPSPTTAVEPESKKGRAAPTDLVCRRDGAPRSAVQCGAIAVHPCRLGKCWQIAAHQRRSGPGTWPSPCCGGRRGQRRPPDKRPSGARKRRATREQRVVDRRRQPCDMPQPASV